jgi:manganese transport protein
VVALSFLLLWITFQPLRSVPAHTPLPSAVAEDLPPSPVYSKILVPVDHTLRDRDAIAHAVAIARQQGSKLYLLHVEEGVTSMVYGPLASTAEVEAGDQYLQRIVRELENQQVAVEAVVRHGRVPQKEIVRYANELQPDLVVMGAHGHRGLKDIVFGTTINAVRHKLKVPLLVVRGGK